MAPRQQCLLDYSAPAGPGVVIVNDRVSIRSEGTHRVVLVHGVVFAHYDVNDGAIEAYTMVALFQSGYADQDEIARAFGYSCRSVRRYEQRLTAGGLSALGRRRGRPSEKARGQADGRDRTILRLKAQDFSNRASPDDSAWRKTRSGSACVVSAGRRRRSPRSRWLAERPSGEPHRRRSLRSDRGSAGQTPRVRRTARRPIPRRCL